MEGVLREWRPDGLRMRAAGDAGVDGDAYKPQPGRRKNRDEEGKGQKLGAFSAP